MQVNSIPTTQFSTAIFRNTQSISCMLSLIKCSVSGHSEKNALWDTHFSLFSPSPPWSWMVGGPSGHQVLAESAICLYRQHLHPRGLISACHPSMYPSTHPPFLCPPSLALSLYPHLSHHSNIFLPIAPTYMSIPPKTSPPHAYCYRF